MADFDFLRQRGIDLLQQICGETWTDYNLHDPGVTLLEALCYALTDLSYRTQFPMADLLADPEGKVRLHHNGFYTPEEMLSTNPVSVNDCRKYMLDNMDLHNIWLEPFMSAFSFGTMHGLYTMRVQVRKDDADKTMDEAWAEILKKEVRSKFVATRNLSEDIIRGITILKPVEIKVQAEVVITGDQPETILAYIYRELERAINPPVRYCTARELLDKGGRMEEIYAGPRLKKGLLPDEALPAWPQQIDPAGLMKAISQVPGVDYIRSLSINSPDGWTDRIPYRLAYDTFPLFMESREDSPISLFNGKYGIRINESAFRDTWARVKEAARRSDEPVVDSLASSTIRHGQHRDLAYYHSVQELLPAIYGIGHDGLIEDPTPLRMAQARQLKGYLLSFEQILADFLAQLANIAEFFSLDNTGRTYHTQPLTKVPGIEPLIRPDYEKTLTEWTEGPDDYLQRRNAVLDHLLARFNERPSDYPVRLYTRLYAGPDDEKKATAVIDWKSQLLKNIVRLSYNRVRGFDYLGGDDKGGDDKGGFQEKMESLLYIRQGSSLTAPLAPHLTSLQQVEPPPQSSAAAKTAGNTPKPTEGPQQQWVTIAGADLMRKRVSPSTQAAETPTTPAGETPAFHQRSLSFFRYGLDPGNYTIGPDPRGAGWLVLYRDPDEQGWQTISRHAGESAAVSALRQLIAGLRRISMESEGFYYLEHVLLRPPVAGECFGFRFMAGKDEDDLLLTQARWTSFEEREDTLKAIIKAALPPAPATDREMSQWGVENLGRRCRMVLSRHKEFGYLTDPADLEPWIFEETAKDFAHIRKELLLQSGNKLSFYPKFEMLVRGMDGKAIEEEFFNFKMTVLMPAWPARFQDPNFRAFAIDLFRQHTPAHIRLSFQWLNITRMREFEDIYPQWLAAMKDQDNTGPRQQWSDRLAHFIRSTRKP